jgi:putative transposase
MHEPHPDLPQQVALFRYGLIAELVRLPPGTPGLYRRLQAIAAEEHKIPGSSRTRAAAETLREWIKRYREGGFDALIPKRRADRGTPRALSAAISEALLAIKADHPQLSVRLLIAQAKASGLVPQEQHLPPSTVHRLFARHGLMQKRPDEPTEQDRRRFAFARAGELWMSDVMHGPSVPVAGRRQRKTYLIGFLDDGTRVAPHGAFALSESTQAFLPVFKRGRGKSNGFSAPSALSY